MTALRVAHRALIRPFKSGPLVEGVWVKCQPGAISIPHRIRFDSANYSRNRPEVIPDGIGELARNFAAPYYNGKRLGRRFGRRWCGEPNDYIGEPDTISGLPIAEDGTPLCCLLPLATRRGGLIIDGVGSVNRFGAVAVGLLQAVLTWDAAVEAGFSAEDEMTTAVAWSADVLAGQHAADDWVTAVSWDATVEANSAYLDDWATAVAWDATVEANSAYLDDWATAVAWDATVEANSAYLDDWATAVAWDATVEASDDPDGVELLCCDYVAPLTLWATFTNVTNCPCIDGITVELTWDGTYWAGTAVGCDGFTLWVRQQPCNESHHWPLEIAQVESGVPSTWISNTQDSWYCDPISLSYTYTGGSGLFQICHLLHVTSQFTVDITETI